jgi:hypothetical protein
MVDSFTRAQSKEVVINAYNAIGAEYIGLKDPILTHFTSNYSIKDHEKI